MGSYCRGHVPYDDHALSSGKTVLSPQIFQGGTPSRLGCSRV